jgi:hypothetical protein
LIAAWLARAMTQADARPLPPVRSSNSPNSTGEIAEAPNPDIAWIARNAPRRVRSAAAKRPVLIVPASAVATPPKRIAAAIVIAGE